MKKLKILIVVAHSDDETIGMGGTIVKHNLRGDKVFAISLTDGVSSRNSFVKNDISDRKKSAQIASKILGFNWLENNFFPDNAMDSVPILDIIKSIEKIKKKINPDIIYTHSGADINIDHRIVANSVLTAFRPQANENWLEIRSFEVPSSSDYGHKSITGVFNPNLFINISKEWPKKLQALKAYKKEIKKFPNSRSLIGIKNLAMHRGNQAGLVMAETFEILKKIDR